MATKKTTNQRKNNTKKAKSTKPLSASKVLRSSVEVDQKTAILSPTQALEESVETSNDQKKGWTLERVFPFLMVIGGFIGLAMSYIITMGKLNLLADPNFVPECNINPIISCGDIMASDQANAFGFPNPFLGLVGFGIVITVGMALLAGAKFKRWFWLGLQIGTTLGAIFCMWLFYQSVYVIGALCPYCMVVWTVTMAMFTYTTVLNLRNNRFGESSAVKKVGGFVQKHHGDILFTWYLMIAVAILTHFWYFWKTLI